MDKNYKYNAADFERYHSGKMNAEEMHALEKAALDDLFLADALEGYSYSASPVKDMSDIRERLLEKEKKKKMFPILSTQNTWLRIAALFILIAGIGYMVYEINFKKEDQMLATIQDSALKNTEQPSSATNTDSTSTGVSKDIVANNLPAKNNEHSFHAEDKSKVLDMKSSGKGSGKISPMDPVGESLQKSVTANAQRDVVFMHDKALTGRVADTIGNRVSFAKISTRDRNIVTRSDSAGRFMLKGNDSSLTADVSAPGYKAQAKKLNNKSEKVIVVENNNKALEEVVVTAAVMQKQKKEVSAKQDNEAEENKTTSEAVNELQKFNEYVKKNIHVPVDEEGKSYKGKVVLSFEVSRKGDPKKIKVEQSLCDACHKEAIRLLRGGLKWKYNKEQRRAITIEF